MKRILFVTPDLNVGGVQRALVSLLKTAPLETFEITLRLFTAGGYLKEELPSEIKFEIADDISAFEGLRARVSALLNKCGLRRTFNIVKSLYHCLGVRIATVRPPLDDSEYDVAIAFSDGLATWYVAGNVPAKRKIAFVHTDLKAAGYAGKTEKTHYSAYETIYFGSIASKKSFEAFLPEYTDKTKLLYTALNEEQIKRQAKEKPDVKLHQDGIRIVTLGRLSHEKGVDKIPGLLKKLVNEGLDVYWYLIGDGAEKEAMEKRISELGITERLILTGTQKNPYSIMSRCDIYVQPSNYEGYCLALAEARVLDLPCVCCNFSGAREQIRDGVSGFITGMSENEIYPRIRELVLSRELREKYARSLQNASFEFRHTYDAFWDSIG